MPLLISDANIFIDFETGGVLRQVFSLQYIVGVPDILFEEELKDQHSHLVDLGLKIFELREPAVARIEVLATQYRHPSRNDLTALALAEQEGGTLLTGDRHLRTAAEAERVEVRGTLWLAERMVRERVISLPALRGAYSKMKGAGRRLPWDEVERQLATMEKLQPSRRR